jgi:excinuclease ABC subunit B
MIRPAADRAPVPGAGTRSRAHDAQRRLVENLAELPGDELARLISTLEEEMAEASADLKFEYAARLRDEIKDLKRELREVG